MTDSQSLEHEFATYGIPAFTDRDLDAFLDRGRARRAANGTLPTRTCALCSRILRDPVSVHRGYGPECAAKVARMDANRTALPNGTLVEIMAGLDEGMRGRVISCASPLKQRRCRRPFQVQYEGRLGRGFYAFDQLRAVDGGDA